MDVSPPPPPPPPPPIDIHKPHNLPNHQPKIVDSSDPIHLPDIPTSFPHLPAPDSVDSTDISDSLPPSTTTETSTSDTPTTSSQSSLLSTTTTILSSPSPTPTTTTFVPSDHDSETAHLTTRIISQSSRFIPSTFLGFSTSTALNNDLIPSSSRQTTYPTDNGNHASNPNNIPPASDGSVGGGTPSKAAAAAQRHLSTGGIFGIVISLALLCFVGFVFLRRRQRQVMRNEHANRWWFSRARHPTEGYAYNAPERPATVYSSSFGSSFERTRSNSLLSSEEFDGMVQAPMVQVGLSARTTPSLSLGPTPASYSPDDLVLDGGSRSQRNADSRFFIHHDGESFYHESEPSTSVRHPSVTPSETSTIHPSQHPPSPKYNSSFSRTSSGRSIGLNPGSPTSRVFIPPIPPLPKSPPPVPIALSNPFLDHNPFDDPTHH